MAEPTTVTTTVTIDEVRKHILTFGKYKGGSIEDIYESDPDYSQWLISQEESVNPQFNRAALYMRLWIDYKEGNYGKFKIPQFNIGKNDAGSIKPKKTLKGLEKLKQKANQEHFYFLWASNPKIEPNFQISGDSLLWQIAIQKWKSEGKDTIIVLKEKNKIHSVEKIYDKTA